MSKVLFDTESKVTAFIDATGTTVVHPTEDTIVVTPSGQAINPATGQPMTNVPGYVSEIAGFLTNTQSTRTGPVMTTEGGSTFLLGSFTPDANGNFGLVPCENGEAKLDWVSGVACAPTRVPVGKSIRFTTYGQPDSAGELKLNVSIARGQFRGDESQTVSNDVTIPIGGDVTPGTLLWVNMEKFNPGYVGLRISVTQ